MSDTDTANGWPNRPTHLAHLWLTVDEEATAAATEAATRGPDALRAHVTQAAPIDDPSLFSDLLEWSLEGIDWQTLADALARP